LRLLLACAITTLTLGALSMLAGRTWSDFLHKIAVEFRSPINMINDASLSAALVTIGIPPHSLLPYAFALAALAAFAAMLLAPVGDELDEALPRHVLIIAGAMGWLVKSWLNYYVVLPFLLLPFAARKHPRSVALILLGFAVSYALPAFDDPRLAASPALHALKLVPYVATPAWLVWLELRAAWPGVLRRAALVVAVVLLAGTGLEAWRLHAMTALAHRGETALAASRPQEALVAYENLLKLSPRDPLASRKRAIALATLGRLDQALAGFAIAEKLAPDDAAAHDDYGRALVMAQRYAQASVQLEAARTLTPDDPQVLVSLAQVRLLQDRQPEAMSLLVRARELAPDDAGIQDLLKAAASQ
jgi:tetratricopeptide (TPR) repeat protein